MTARKRIQGLALAITLVALLGLVAAACAGAEPTSTPRPSPTAAPAPTVAVIQPTATPLPTSAPPTPVGAIPTTIAKEGRRGGIIEMRALSNIASWDTYDTRNATDWRFLAPMYNNLIQPDPYNETVIVGDLARSWSVSGDGTAYVFNLTPGVTWHDGKPVTSADIVYTLQRGRALNPNPATAVVAKRDLASVANVEAVDQLTVKVTLQQPSASFLGRLGQQRMAMYPAHLPFPDVYDAYAANPIGSGPFKFKEYKRDQFLSLTRNDNYFKKGLPYLDGIFWHILLSDANQTAIAAYRTGRFHAIVGDGGLLPPILDGIIRQGFIPQKATAGRSDLLLNNKPPFNDKRVRQAISIGLNRKLVLDFWLRGAGDTLAAPAIPPQLGGKWGLPAEEMAKRPGFPTARPEDIARAQQLFKEAGVNPAQLTIEYLGVLFFKDFGEPEAVATALQELGFKVNIVLPAGVEATSRLQRGDFDIVHQIRSPLFDDPLDSGGMVSVLTGFPTNYGKWSDPEFDRLAEEQERSLDEAKRKALVYEMQRRFLDNAFAIPVLYRDYIGGAFSFVKNYPPFAFSFSPFHRWEQVWLDRR